MKALLTAVGAKRDWLAFTPLLQQKRVYFFWEKHFQIVLIVTGNEQYLELESYSGLAGVLKHPLAQETSWFCGLAVLWKSRTIIKNTRPGCSLCPVKGCDVTWNLGCPVSVD